MDRNTSLTNETLIQLGFDFEGELWYHIEEEDFAIEIRPTFFNVYYKGYHARHPYLRTVGVLEKLFYERTGKLLF